MAVYLLQRILKTLDGLEVGESAVGYEEAYAIVVIAPDARTARNAAVKETGKDIWNDTSNTQVRQVPARTTTPRVVLIAISSA